MLTLQLSVLDQVFPGKHSSGDRTLRAAAKSKAIKALWSSKQSFIFPIHWNNNHWFVVRGDAARASWEVYDSITNSEAARTVVEVR